MRILHLGKYYPPTHGGIETVTRDLVEGTAGRGYQCDVIVASQTAERKTETWYSNGTSYTVTRAATRMTIASTPLSPDYIRAFREVKDNYDLVILHLPNPLACLALFLSGYRGTVGLIWHSDVIRQKVLLKTIQWLQSWTIKRAEFVIGATPAHLEESDSASVIGDKGTVIPFGLDPETAGLSCEEAASEVSAKERVNLLAVGRLVYYKGFTVLIEALAKLPDAYVLTIAGEGPMREELEQKCASLSVSDRVNLAGRVSSEELQRLFIECDIFCLPSIERAEMYGMVQLEAMSFGKPVVATAIPRSGTRYVNRDGVTGFTVASKDVDAFAAAIKRLGDDPELRARCGRAAQELFQREYTVDKMVEHHIALYSRYIPSEREFSSTPSSKAVDQDLNVRSPETKSTHINAN